MGKRGIPELAAESCPVVITYVNRRCKFTAVLALDCFW